MLPTVHAVSGSGWFEEHSSQAAAEQAVAIRIQEGIPAQYRESLPARFALVIEFRPNMAGRSGHPSTPRRHKWAYGEWQDGAPEGYNADTGEMPDLWVAERIYKSTGAVSSYINKEQRQRLIVSGEIEPDAHMMSRAALHDGVY